jgi:protein-disulfide isomerase
MRSTTAAALMLLAFAAWPAAVPAQTPARSQPLVQIDGEGLDVEAALRPYALQILRAESQLYAIRRKAIDDAIARRLLEREAARRSVTVETLLAQEVDAKVTPPTDADVDAQLARRQGGPTLSDEERHEARAGMRAALTEQRRAEQRQKLVTTLRERAKIVVDLEPPVLMIPIATDGEPARGAADAPVTIVEFSDFQCPYCRQAQATLKTLMERFPGKVRIVHRDFPVTRLHPGAERAAEAARCAGEQGKFWEYHDILYAGSGKQTEADLVRHASELSLDAASFADCLRSKRQVSAVARGLADGKQIGVTGTPTYFINGTPLIGARPLSEFVALVERELQRQASSGDARRMTR